MKKFLTALLLCVVSATAVAKSDDCVISPYDGKTYCCNVRDNNLPNGAINKSWGEVMPWSKYHGTVRKCVGGQITNDTFGNRIDGVAPNLGTRIRKEASDYNIAWYTKFDGTYWYAPTCDNENYGAYSTKYDWDTGGCRFEGLLDVGDMFFKCGAFGIRSAEDYIRAVTDKSIVFKNVGEFIRRSPDSYGEYVIFECTQNNSWIGTPFCTESDMPTDEELHSGVLDHLKDGWLMKNSLGQNISMRGYNYGYEYEGDGYLDCWTRGTVMNTQNAETKYNYKSCSTDADCTGIDNKKSPYLHSTAWKCIEQTPGVHVCAARECETGWTPINGYCQQQTKATNPVQTSVSPTLPGNTPDDITAPVQTPNCSDPINMDADCKCTRVAETVERGGVCVCTDSNKEIKGGKCEYTAAYRSTLKADIDSKYSKIKSLTASFEVNKWKDAEGNFNTARLASDSIAGVVLGTAGGIITSKLVKKNQLKKGFEDIQCHIGGQSVADYGDEFTVGR